MNAPPMRPPAAGEQRQRHDLRQAVVRLRLAEFQAADHLPADLMQELTAALDQLTDALRARAVLQ